MAMLARASRRILPLVPLVPLLPRLPTPLEASPPQPPPGLLLLLPPLPWLSSSLHRLVIDGSFPLYAQLSSQPSSLVSP